MIRKLLYSVSFAFIFSTSVGISAPAYANKDVTKQELSTIQKELKKAEQEKGSAATLARKEEQELKKLQQNLIDTAQQEKKIEQNMVDLEEQIDLLQEQKQQTHSILLKEKKHFSDLVLAVQRLSRTPPEAFLAKPNAPIDSARAHLILKSTLPAIKKQADIISNHLASLEETEKSLIDKKKNLEKLQADLQKKNNELNALVEKRKNIHKTYVSQSKEFEDNIQKLAQKADSLKEILSELEKQERLVSILPRPQAKPSLAPSSGVAQRTAPTAPNTATSAPASGVQTASVVVPRNISDRLPTAGRVVIGFGQKNEYGVTNRGITIQGRPNATVTTPLGGIVRFSGPFKGHKNLLIIEHADGSMGLIDGMEVTNVVVGQTVLGGEPVGRLRNLRDRDHADLYYELRKNGKPVDPLRSLSALAKAG